MHTVFPVAAYKLLARTYFLRPTCSTIPISISRFKRECIFSFNDRSWYRASITRKSSVDSSSEHLSLIRLITESIALSIINPFKRDADKEIVRSGKVGKRFCLLHTQLKHQIHSLSGSLNHATQRKNFRNTAIARELAIQYIVKRDAKRKSSRAFNNQSVSKLTNKDATPRTDSFCD